MVELCGIRSIREEKDFERINEERGLIKVGRISGSLIFLITSPETLFH